MTNTSNSNKIITQYSLTKINQLICFLIKEFVKERLYEPQKPPETGTHNCRVDHSRSCAKLRENLRAAPLCQLLRCAIMDISAEKEAN